MKIKKPPSRNLILFVFLKESLLYENEVFG